MMKYYRISLMISFATKLKDERIDDELWDYVSYTFVIEVYREMKLCME